MPTVLAKTPIPTDCCTAWFTQKLNLVRQEFALLDQPRGDLLQESLLRRINWSTFDWQRDCKVIHEGTMKVVGQLKEHPHVAIVSVQEGTGSLQIHKEVDLLSELVDVHGIRCVPFSRTVLDVAHYDPCSAVATAKAYLQFYFTYDMCFPFKLGDPCSEDYYEDSMRKLRICQEDEGIWEFNGDTIRTLNLHGLQKPFMEDLTNYVKLLSKNLRVVDLQGVLGLDGHFYLADPLDIWSISSAFSRYFLEGVFKHPRNSPRHYAAYSDFGVYFVDGLGVELGILVHENEQIYTARAT